MLGNWPILPAGRYWSCEENSFPCLIHTCQSPQSLPHLAQYEERCDRHIESNTFITAIVSYCSSNLRKVAWYAHRGFPHSHVMIRAKQVRNSCSVTKYASTAVQSSNPFGRRIVCFFSPTVHNLDYISAWDDVIKDIILGLSRNDWGSAVSSRWDFRKNATLWKQSLEHPKMS